MWGARVIVTAVSPAWVMAAARAMTGFATSVIGCKCEAGIERELSPSETPDGRPGVSVLLFSMSADSVGKRLLERVGQCVMTAPTTACFNGLTAEQEVAVGGKLRYFGDGYQIAKFLDGRRYWRIPVMDGEFVVEDRFGLKPSVGGGNLLILGPDLPVTLAATEAAVAAMRQVPGVILPFPDGIVRSGSKPGSKYKGLPASTNDAYCPTLARLRAGHRGDPRGRVRLGNRDRRAGSGRRDRGDAGRDRRRRRARRAPHHGRELRRQPGPVPDRPA